VSIRLLWRRGLLVLAGAGAIAVAAPAVASAATTVTLTPNSVAAGSTGPLEIDQVFSPSLSGGDVVTTTLPAGLLANADLNGGACLLSADAQAGCQVGSGTVNPGAVSISLWLVAGPNPGHDVAGVALCAGASPCTHLTALATADVTNPTGNGLVFTVTNAVPGVAEFDLHFTALRMPTSCPSPAANLSVAVNSGTAGTAGLTVTGCSSLAYTPTMTATVKADAGPGSGAEVISSISQPNAGTESATKATTLGFGTSLTPNAGAVAACFVTPCKIGSATATSPLIPSLALNNGTVTLGGSLTAPTLTITFPLLNLSLVGAIDLTHNTVTFSNEPDVPISSLNVDVTGPSTGGKAFTTTCQAATLTGAFTPWSGNAVVNRSAQIQYTGCPTGGAPGKPTVSGSLSGLGKRQPKLKFTVHAGSNAPKISSVSVGPSQGLSFRKCVKKGKKHLCAGMSVSGGTVKTEKISGGRLTVTLSGSASSMSVTAMGPALVESKSLQTKVQHHKIKTITFSIKVKDATGKTSVLTLKLKV
jgi:hypothetical protein